jgi:phospholipid/cholesterol/gamma-HCH transport system substrate-binding protein
MEDLRYTLQSVARHVDAVAQNLEATSRNLNEFSRVIRQNPGVLLDGSDPPDVAAGEGE